MPLRLRPVDLVGSVSASMLASQAVCEYRVHLDVQSGGRMQARGGASDVGELVSLMLGVPRSTYRAEVGGVTIVARPHAVFEAAGSTVVVRASLGGLRRPGLRDRVYLEASALAVGVESAVLAFISAGSVEGLREAVERLKRSPRPALGSGWAVSTWLFNREEALERVGRLLAYWRGERGPVPRPSPAKCRACPYSTVCPYSAARGDGSGVK
ncbi:hypothetical protein [Stetteria hydrogenophila]